MEELEKLQVLLPHWIDHNKGHSAECLKWAEAVGTGEVQQNLKAAFGAMENVNRYLEKALVAAGGAADGVGHAHHHHHHN